MMMMMIINILTQDDHIINYNNNFIDLYCANINPENFHLRITLLNKILKS